MLYHNYKINSTKIKEGERTPSGEYLQRFLCKKNPSALRKELLRAGAKSFAAKTLQPEFAGGSDMRSENNFLVEKRRVMRRLRSFFYKKPPNGVHPDVRNLVRAFNRLPFAYTKNSYGPQARHLTTREVLEARSAGRREKVMFEPPYLEFAFDEKHAKTPAFLEDFQEWLVERFPTAPVPKFCSDGTLLGPETHTPTVRRR